MRVSKRENGFELTPSAAGAPIQGSHLLLAVGRRPNTDDLGLDAAGVQTDAHGYIVVDDQLRTTVDHIWAMGDCNGKALSPTRPTTTSRSSPRTCSMTTHVG